MVTDGQIRSLQRWLNEGNTLRESARRSDMDEKTARRYRELGSAARVRPPRSWRTRQDPFVDVWASVEARLVADPRLKAVTLFAQLQREHPGRFPDSQRRSFERRVRRWRALSGGPKAVIFEQIHPPGRLCSFDFTEATSLKVTIAGRAFPHLLFHGVLTHSNAESVRICASESFESMSAGLQGAFHEFGGVTQRVRSDSLSAAVNNLSEEREFRQRYQALLDHYQVEGEKTNPRQAHENGDAESSHNHFKRALDQELRLRESRDFATREEYDQFLQALRARRNAARPAMAAELTTLRPLPRVKFEAPVRLKVRVAPTSLIHVRANLYSVHSRLIGRQVEVLFRETTLEVYLGDQLVETLPRLMGRGQEEINYRHIIDGLLRKPGALAHYRYRAALFPTTNFRIAFDELTLRLSERSATKEYLQILKLAATESEELVERALAKLASDEHTPLSAKAVEELVREGQRLDPPTHVHVEPPDLRAFDSLLHHKEVLNDCYANEEVSVEPIASELAAGVGLIREPAGGGAENAGDGVADNVVVADVATLAADAVGEPFESAAAADVPRALREPGADGATRVVDLPAVPRGADGAGVSGARRAEDHSLDAGFASASGQDVERVRLETASREGGQPSAEPARRLVPGSLDEPVDLWAPRFGEDARLGGAGRTIGATGSIGLVCTLLVALAGSLAGEARLEAAAADRPAGEVRGADHRRPGLRAAESRGDGSAVHVTGRALRAIERAAEQQPGVLAVGADLQRSNDDGGRHRPPGASQRDRRAEHPQLPPRRGQALTAGDFRRRFVIQANRPPGILIVAKAEK